MKKLLSLALLLAASPALAQLPGNAHRYTPTNNDSDRGATTVTFTSDADCDITSKTNCTVVGNTSGFDDGQYLGTLTITTGTGVTLTADRKVVVSGGPGRDYHAFNITAGGKQACITTSSSSVTACAPNGVTKPVYVVTGNGVDYYAMGSTPAPVSTKVVGTDANGQFVAASSSDVVAVIGSGVYDPANAAAARAAVGSCLGSPTGQYMVSIDTTGVHCARITEVHATSGSIDGVPVGATNPSTVHASSLTVDDLAGAADDLLASVNTTGKIGISNVHAPAASLIPTSNILGYVTVTPNTVTVTGDITSGSTTISNVSDLTGIAAGQQITGLGIPDTAVVASVTAPSTITLSVAATSTLTMNNVTIFTGGATLSFTTGINAACPGISLGCGIQQNNAAPTDGSVGGGTYPTQKYVVGDAVIHVNTLANVNNKSIIVLHTGQGGATFIGVGGTNIDTSVSPPDYQLTNLTPGYWGSPTTWTGAYYYSGDCLGIPACVPADPDAKILQVSQANSASATSTPSYVVLQNQSIINGLNQCVASGAGLWDCLGDGTGYQTIYNAGLLTSGQVQHTFNPVNGSTPPQNLRLVSYGNFFDIETRWSEVSADCEMPMTGWFGGSLNGYGSSHFGYVIPPGDVGAPTCTAAANGAEPGEFAFGWSTSGSPLSKITSGIVFPFRIGMLKTTSDNPLYVEEIVGHGSTPSIVFSSGSGTIAGNIKNGVITMSASGTATFTMTLPSGHSYPTRSFCTFEDETAGTFLHVTGSTTTTITATGTVTSGDTVTYHGCEGS